MRQGRGREGSVHGILRKAADLETSLRACLRGKLATRWTLHKGARGICAVREVNVGPSILVGGRHDFVGSVLGFDGELRLRVEDHRFPPFCLLAAAQASV